MNPFRRRTAVAVLAAVTLVATACGSDDESNAARPTVVVTTNILGDVVSEVVAGQADVVTIMPVGADPHDFQASAQEIDRLLSAEAVIVNGAGFEEGLLDVIESAENDGVPTYEAIAGVSTIEFGAGGSDEDHGDEEGDETGGQELGDEHERDGADPHFFTDPARMAVAVEGIVGFLIAEVDGLDAAALEASAADYVDALLSLDEEVTTLVESVDPASRVLVTNHEVFGYFADRYGFEVVGAVIPGGSTTDAASAGELAELAEIIEAEGVPAIFADTSATDELVNALASEVGGVAVVELYSESLGTAGSDGATYLEMVRSNAERITSALA